MSAQPALFRLPRIIERGDPTRCATCGRFDHTGGHGPPGLVEVEGIVRPRDETWFCASHLAHEWRAYQRNRAQLAKRQRRWEAFRTCRREGFRGLALLAEAERRLTDPKEGA